MPVTKVWTIAGGLFITCVLASTLQVSAVQDHQGATATVFSDQNDRVPHPPSRY